ncbi:UNVERIFIED_CONTAM: GDSL esterase/lipase [Sesamum latifolium]|uniref:GDSL esterase/lipase n=1 Tax=Sesamum latifolium TaxID=2727402 RepID=A0AAW2WT31_9LAMI
MGRRKERRLAAISAAGRRVKLDLFAEPSGDLGGSSAQEEVGGDGAKTHAELPSSPTSSGQQNPLLLLEQYSDEELDEGSNEGHNHAVAEDTSNDIDEEANSAAEKETEGSENNNGKEPTTRKADQPLMNDSSQDPLHKLEEGSIAEIDSDDLPRQTNKMEEATCLAAPDAHLVGDVSSGWKMVLHEESNQYYYWNTVTGETSWEVPDVLSQETGTTPVEKILDDNEDCVEKLQNALFMVGEIGGNDYNYAIFQGKTMEELRSMVPHVVATIVDAARKVIEVGGKRVVIPGNFPIGCLPIYKTAFQTNNSAAYDKNRCLNHLNEFAKYHNQELQKAIHTQTREPQCCSRLRGLLQSLPISTPSCIFSRI